MYRTVEIDRKQEVERGGMTRRIRPLGSGFEPGSPATRAIASAHGAGALPAELCSTPKCELLCIVYVHLKKHTNRDKCGGFLCRMGSPLVIIVVNRLINEIL